MLLCAQKVCSGFELCSGCYDEITNGHSSKV